MHAYKITSVHGKRRLDYFYPPPLQTITEIIDWIVFYTASALFQPYNGISEIVGGQFEVTLKILCISLLYKKF